MSVRNITEEQYWDRLEWLMGAAGHELIEAAPEQTEVVVVLDRIKQAAEQCAKYLREGPNVSVPTESVQP